MSVRKCSSCGQVSSGKTVYCPGCGSILPKIPVESSGEPLLPAVAAEAARQTAKRQRPEIRTRPRRSIPFLPILFLLALTGVGYLVFSDSGYENTPPQNIKNAAFLVNRSFASSKFTQATLTQDVINSLLWETGGMKVGPILGFITPPEWSPLTLGLEPDKFTCHLVMTVRGHPVQFSETFRVEADPGVYKLAAESATVGRLRLPGPMASLVTPVFGASSAPFSAYLENLRMARSLSISEGSVTFSTR